MTWEPPEDTLQQVASTIIQRTWRRYLRRAVFKYVKELIGRCDDLDPRTVLRDVNPREAELLDAAAGVFVRFRLGGISFPPSIYYKIFTYRPIVDVCASGLRDWRSGALKQEDRSGWYQRTENNNWRLFSDKVAYAGEPAEVGADKRMAFHSSRLQRRQEVARWRKRRKIEWMKKMYINGRLRAAPEPRDAVDSSAREAMDAVEDKGEDEILEWEVDELLAWTNTLNFEEYIQEWKLLACSQTSEFSKDRSLR
ncbi:protein MFI [Kryptolebias marmoratus]|uniref:protein MFI n=1 Tax=Kryptolebias marmoratus TaxID=37003 RepID=UPI0018ACA00D|nr:protein MFI [Kryptolebias marmoratus]XP_037829013.1 protein MFI [Kryptolebias marmoratus]